MYLKKVLFGVSELGFSHSAAMRTVNSLAKPKVSFTSSYSRMSCSSSSSGQLNNLSHQKKDVQSRNMMQDDFTESNRKKLFRSLKYANSFLLLTFGLGAALWIHKRAMKNSWFSQVSAAKPISTGGNSSSDDKSSSWKGESRLGSSAKSGNILDNDGNKISNRMKYNFLADVVESVTKAVVSIEVKDHSMIDWFSGTPQTASNGSGFIINDNGLILTNAHVVAGCQRSAIIVSLHILQHMKYWYLKRDLYF